MEETEEDTSKWNDSPCLWIGRINIVKMSIIYQCVEPMESIPNNITMEFFHRNRKKQS